MIDQVCFDEALLEGTKEVFETMIFVDMQECSEPDEHVEGDSLLGSITFNGDLEGCLTICCAVPCAKAIALNMLGMESDEEISQAEINDAMGEVANMVMGSVKARLQDSVGNMNVSIPTVVSGRGLDSSLSKGTNRILMKVNIEDEYIIEFLLLYRESAK